MVNKRAVVKYFMVVLFERHFQVKSHKLCQVAMGKRILGTEYGTHFIYSLKVRADEHLLVELRRLRKICVG
jgi:hypothetical protein